MNAPSHVLVAGGGPAAAETVLALRDLAGDALQIEIVSASPHLVHRATATLPDPAAAASLRELATSTGSTFRQDTVEAVAGAVRKVRLGSGKSIPYEALVLALGARARSAIPGATVFRDRRDRSHLDRIVADIQAGAVSSVVLAAPAGIGWTLPAYELALGVAEAAEQAPHHVKVTVATPEKRPMESFGRAVAGAVADLLEDAGIRFVGGALPNRVTREGLELSFSPVLPADRVIALPALSGQRISGLPCDFQGFVSIDPRNRVPGLDDVYAVGDMTTFPIKQGGIAAQQADRVAETIALGGRGDLTAGYVLKATLAGGAHRLALSALLDPHGKPLDGEVSLPESDQLAFRKVDAVHLSPWLAARRDPELAIRA